MHPLLPLGGVALAPRLEWLRRTGPGPPLRTPSDAREDVRLCALGQPDSSCQALMPTLREVQGPVSVILGGGPDPVPDRAEPDRGRVPAGPGPSSGVCPRQHLSCTPPDDGHPPHAGRQGACGEVLARHGAPRRGETWCQIGELRAINRFHSFKDAVGRIYITAPYAPGGLSFFLF